MAESSDASVASLQEHVPSEDGDLEPPSFIEVARVTTGEMPSVAPTTLGDRDSGIDRPPAIFGSLTKEILVIAVCTWAPGGAAASIGLVLVGLNIIAKDLGMSQGEIAWIPSSMSLTSGSFLLLGGRLSDLYGRKRMCVYSMLAFTVWTLIASFATEKYLFFVSRGMQGVFSAGSIPAALGILGAAYPPGKRKNRVFATFSAGNPTGWVVGLVIGGILISYSSWRWAFRLVTILGAIFTAVAFVVIPKDPPRDPLQRKEKVDWFGAVLVIGGITGICYPLSDSDNAPNGWRTWYIPFSLVLGFVLLGAFVFWESKVRYPLMPLAIWKVPQFFRLMVVVGLGFVCFTGFLGFTWALWFQQIDKTEPITTTLYFLPQFFSGILGNVIAAMSMHRINGTILLVFSMLCYTVSGLLGALQSPGTIYWAMSFPAMLTGVIGADLSNVIANMFATSNVSKEFQSISVAIVVTMFSIAQTVSQSITSALITGIGGNALSGDIPVDQLAKGYHAAFWCAVGCSIIAAILAATLKIGKRGHKEDRDMREVRMIQINETSVLGSTSVHHEVNNIELTHRGKNTNKM